MNEDVSPSANYAIYQSNEQIIYHDNQDQNPFEKLKSMSIADYVKENPVQLLTPKPTLIAAQPAYQWSEDCWLNQNRMHWIYDEIPMHSDKVEWASMDKGSKDLLTKLFLFFTQIEVEVNQMYTRYMNVFQPFEVKKMLLKYADMETMHAAGYKYLMANIFGEKANEMLHQFLDHQTMKDKYEALQQYSTDTVQDLCLTLVMFGGFSEGVLLYASFAIFLFFPDVKKVLKGTGQILSWSMRDESLHVSSMAQLYKSLMKELPRGFHEHLTPTVYKKAREMVQLEMDFIDWIFENSCLKEVSNNPSILELNQSLNNNQANDSNNIIVAGLNKEDLKQYIRFQANTRLQQFGFQPIYNATSNPLPWMSSLGNTEFSNFFETTVTEYNRLSATSEEVSSETIAEWLFEA